MSFLICIRCHSITVPKNLSRDIFQSLRCSCRSGKSRYMQVEGFNVILALHHGQAGIYTMHMYMYMVHICITQSNSVLVRVCISSFLVLHHVLYDSMRTTYMVHACFLEHSCPCIHMQTSTKPQIVAHT